MPSRWTAFFSAVEELDPTLAVVLGRPRLGTKISKIGVHSVLVLFMLEKNSLVMPVHTCTSVRKVLGHHAHYACRLSCMRIYYFTQDIIYKVLNSAILIRAIRESAVAEQDWHISAECQGC